MSARRFFGLFTLILLVCALAGCATQSTNRVAYHSGSRPTPLRHTYLPPGPPDDPWGPYIRAASQRFGVSEMWIRAVMRQESSGQEYRNGEPITSSAGATGLMQVMPDTYEMLRLRYALGPDPYEPHDNIFAGTAYIREMYDIYGFPGFLAAYNAGPHALEACLATGVPLPMETVNYLSSVAPKLRAYAVLSGPLAAYADTPQGLPADDLNRRSLMGQPMPAVQYIATPSLPCSPSAEDRSADVLNRNVLAGRPANSYSYSRLAANQSMGTLIRKSAAAAPPQQPVYHPEPAASSPAPAYADGSHVLGVLPAAAQPPQPTYRSPPPVQPAVAVGNAAPRAVPVAAAGSDSDKIGELLINQDYGASGR